MTALYRQLLGADFDRLPMTVKELHDVTAECSWLGRANVERGGCFAGAIATLLGLPPVGADQLLAVTFTPRGDTEIWTRRFGTRLFASTQWAAASELCERIGPVTLHMTMQADEQKLGLTLAAVKVVGVPLPAWASPRIYTREFERCGRCRFEVEVQLPGLGRLVRYEGWLERAAR